MFIKHRSLLAALVVGSVIAWPAFGGVFWGGQTFSTALTCPANDGSSAAPSATIQYPSLLSGYATTITAKLGCNVAGVNYAVGYPSSTVLSDPAAGGLPTGASYGLVGGVNTISISGSSAITLDSWDLSLHGGIAVQISSTGGVTIKNSKIQFPSGLGVNPVAEIQIESAAQGGLTLLNNIIDGGGGFYNGDFIYNAATAANNVTMQYNWVKNLPNQNLDQVTGGTVTMKYNVFYDIGIAQPGNHLNVLEWSGSSATYSTVVQFNTVVMHNSGNLGNEIFQFYDNSSGGTLTSADAGYNTMISLPTNPNAVARSNSTTYNNGTMFTAASVNGTLNVYLVCAESAWCTNQGAGATCTTASSLPVGYTTAGAGVSVTDGTCTVQGSTYIISYFFHGSNDASFVTKMSPGPAQVHDNFMDFSGSLNGYSSCVSSSQSMFYPGTYGTANGPTGTVAWTAPSGNYNMVSGGTVCPSAYP